MTSCSHALLTIPILSFPVQVISLDEFREGCRLLNKNLHPDYQLTDVEHMLKLMDFDGSGTIDINEFFEVRC